MFFRCRHVKNIVSLNFGNLPNQQLTQSNGTIFVGRLVVIIPLFCDFPINSSIFSQKRQFLLTLMIRLPANSLSPMSNDWLIVPKYLSETSRLLRIIFHKWRVTSTSNILNVFLSSLYSLAFVICSFCG